MGKLTVSPAIKLTTAETEVAGELRVRFVGLRVTSELRIELKYCAGGKLPPMPASPWPSAAMALVNPERLLEFLVNVNTIEVVADPKSGAVKPRPCVPMFARAPRPVPVPW